MKMKKLYLLGLVGVMALALPGESVRAQSMQDLEKQLKKIVQDMVERFSEASGGWPLGQGGGAKNDEEPISFMLQHKDGLELSSQQIKSLKKLRSRFERTSIRREADIKVAKMELKELMEEDSIDLEKTEGKVREVERLRGDQKLSRIHKVAEAKALLGPDQRKKLVVLQASNSAIN